MTPLGPWKNKRNQEILSIILLAMIFGADILASTYLIKRG